MLLCDDIIHNRGKIILPHFNTYSTYHLSAGGPGRRAPDQWLPKVHPQNNCLQVTWGKKKIVFLSHRFLDPTPGLGCEAWELLFLKNFPKGFHVQPAWGTMIPGQNQTNQTVSEQWSKSGNSMTTSYVRHQEVAQGIQAAVGVKWLKSLSGGALILAPSMALYSPFPSLNAPPLHCPAQHSILPGCLPAQSTLASHPDLCPPVSIHKAPKISSLRISVGI